MVHPFTHLRTTLLAALILVGAEGSPLGAQWVHEPVLERFGLRIGSLPGVVSWDQLTGPGGAVPLGAGLTDPEAGTRLLPHLAPVEVLVDDLSGTDGFRIRLGATRGVRSTTLVTVPVSLEFGVTSFLTVGGSLPFVRRRLESSVRITPEGANAGFNPNLQEPAAVEAFLTAFDQALTEGRALHGDLCGSAPGNGECEGWGAALADGQELFDGLLVLYGNSPLVPLEESGAGMALTARFSAVVGALEALGVAPLDGTPPLALVPLDAGGLDLLATAGRFGVGVESLQTVQRPWELGDAEIHATARVLERVERDTTGSFTSRVLVVGTAVVRLPTGTVAGARSPLDPGTGGGSTDFTAGAMGDLSRPRWGARVDARFTRRGDATLVRRLAAPDALLAGEVLERTLTRSGGDLLEMEVAPRVGLSPDFGVGVAYRFSRRSADTWAVQPGGGRDPGPLDPIPADVSVLAAGSEGSLHHAGIHLTYSTVNAHREGRTGGRPFEVFVRYEQVLSASGALVAPRTRSLQGGVRIHLFGY